MAASLRCQGKKKKRSCNYFLGEPLLPGVLELDTLVNPRQRPLGWTHGLGLLASPCGPSFGAVVGSAAYIHPLTQGSSAPAEKRNLARALGSGIWEVPHVVTKGLDM